jgi:hypothetical protein
MFIIGINYRFMRLKAGLLKHLTKKKISIIFICNFINAEQMNLNKSNLFKNSQAELYPQ